MKKVIITASVGENSKNNIPDVRQIQQALNIIISQNILTPIPLLKEDGIAGQYTKTAIRQFQRRSAGMASPDGRIDVSGKSILKLNRLIEISSKIGHTKHTNIPAINHGATNKSTTILTAVFQKFNQIEYGILAGSVIHASSINNNTVDSNGDLKKLSQRDFVKAVFTEAKKEEAISNVPAAITTAQAILETGYGKSVPTDMTTKKYSYNLFGIKGVGPAGSVSIYTHEYVNGKKIQIVDSFKAYNSFSQSIQGRTAFLTKNKRYKSLFETKDAKKWAEGLQKAGYATDPKYANKLIDIMTMWKLI